MTTFRVGDKVRSKKHGLGYLSNKTGTVIGLVQYGPATFVKVEVNDYESEFMKGNGIYFHPDNLCPAEPTDAELADEYRAAKKRVAEIVHHFAMKDFMFQSKLPEESVWRAPTSLVANKTSRRDWEHRFMKKIVTTEEITF
jgi:hypothetical protein